MIPILDAATVTIEEILAKRDAEQADVSATVAAVLSEVKQNGDVALLAYTKQFDGASLQSLRVQPQEIAEARQQVGEEFIQLLERAAANLRAYHQKQVRQGFVMAEQPGVVMGQRVLPLQKVGVYVPGGTAPYPSTVLMDVIPAKIAGVEQIIMVTPPGKDGKVNAAILAAASVAGATDIFKVGGAQAIAALAYGTATVPKVDKIVGPGNIYVATAKKMVYGTVDIDMIAGPSDVLVVADSTADAVNVAGDMLAQAEHDKLAAAVLVTTDAALANKVAAELARQLLRLPRQEIARASIENNGKIILAQTLEQALEISNAIAPEHLELAVAEPFALLPLVKNAGSVFLGHNTPEALGDYLAGPNHTLPTAGTARFYSPLSVDDYCKKSSYLYYSNQALQNVAADVQAFARSEQLDAHANSVTLRVDRKNAL